MDYVIGVRNLCFWKFGFNLSFFCKVGNIEVDCVRNLDIGVKVENKINRYSCFGFCGGGMDVWMLFGWNNWLFSR